jgi:NADPH:quinone reductase-like Zn-dependent oxidoreductase
MQAVVHQRYGAPGEVLGVRDVERPSIGEGEVLVRVATAGVHVGDCFGVRGTPLPLRLVSGLRRPKVGIPGLDIAGVVEAVGGHVTRFKPGDEVFGVCGWPSAGACAEYARAKEADLIAKPEGVSFEEAAAIPTSALAALHGLRDAGKVQHGQRVLINGASGGVGTFAVQIAKALGVEVTAVCSTANAELVLGLGADHVIDYSREDFTQGAARYDVILDNVENRPLSQVRRALTPRGTLVLNSGTGARGLRMARRLIWPLILSVFVRQRLRRYLSTPTAADLAALVALNQEGRLRPVVDQIYPLADTAAALQYIETGHARGKVVIGMPVTRPEAAATSAPRSAQR